MTPRVSPRRNHKFYGVSFPRGKKHVEQLLGSDLIPLESRIHKQSTSGCLSRWIFSSLFEINLKRLLYTGNATTD